jgi:hypothetical protein
MLVRRLPEDSRAQVGDHYSVIDPAVIAAERYHDQHNEKRFSEEYNKAEEALYQLLQFAYNWKYTNMNPVILPGLIGPV